MNKFLILMALMVSFGLFGQQPNIGGSADVDLSSSRQVKWQSKTADADHTVNAINVITFQLEIGHTYKITLNPFLFVSHNDGPSLNKAILKVKDNATTIFEYSLHYQMGDEDLYSRNITYAIYTMVTANLNVDFTRTNNGRMFSATELVVEDVTGIYSPTEYSWVD